MLHTVFHISMHLSDKNLMLQVFHINHLAKTLCYKYFTLLIWLKPYVTSISHQSFGKNLMLQVFHINHLAKTLCYKYFTLIIWQKPYVTSISH